jgi:hypothetical protein
MNAGYQLQPVCAEQRGALLVFNVGGFRGFALK